MKLIGPIEKYLTGPTPTHTSRARLSSHITFYPQAEVESLLMKGGYLTTEGRITALAQREGLVDTCEGKPLWNLRKTKQTLLAATRKQSQAKPARSLAPSRPAPTGPVWTDLENIGTYFGVGKNKVGAWLDQLGLRGYKPVQVNESGDVDMLDVANMAKEKFNAKIPTEKALNAGIAQVETIEYKQKGKDKSFEKYTWDRDRVKALLVQAGHELDTERKLLLKGKGRNGNVKVESLDDRAQTLYDEWRALHTRPATRNESWRVFDRKPAGILTRVEQLMGRPRYLRDRLYLKEK